MVWNKDKTQFTLIDFEYSSLNFRGYDLASYVNECLIDYTHPINPKFKVYMEYFDQFWEEGELDKFLTYYLTKYHEIMIERQPEYEYKENFKQLLEVELPILRDQVLRCILMSHLQWAFWTMIMMPVDDLQKCQDFYLEYGLTRLQMYFKQRPIFLGSNSSQ